MRRILLVLPASFVTGPALAQVEDRALWLTATGNVAVDRRTRITVETSYRFSDRRNGLSESLWIGGVTREVAKDVAVHVSYARVTVYSRGRISSSENRVRAQVEATPEYGSPGGCASNIARAPMATGPGFACARGSGRPCRSGRATSASWRTTNG